MNTEIKKYAEMLMSMSTDYLMGNYDEQLYLKMIELASNKLSEFKV